MSDTVKTAETFDKAATKKDGFIEAQPSNGAIEERAQNQGQSQTSVAFYVLTHSR